MAVRFVNVDMESMKEGKCVSRNGEVAKRCWKYGEAARNIFLWGVSYGRETDE